MNSNALLALLSDLYAQVATLTEENARLRERIAGTEAAGDSPR